MPFQKRIFVWRRVVTGFGDLEIASLLDKLEVQGWSQLFIQGDSEKKFGRPKVYKFYINGSENRNIFSTVIRDVSYT